MSTQYRWPPGIERSMKRTLELLRGELANPALLVAQQQIKESAEAVAHQLENSAMESVRRHLDAIQRQRLDFDVFEARLRSPVVDALEALNAQHAELRLQLERTIAPLPGLVALQKKLSVDYHMQQRAATSAFHSLSRAIEQASLLWYARLPDFESADEDSEEQPVEQPPSEQLVKIVPVEALRRLESADLLPLRVLDRIYRAPKAVYQITPRQFEHLVAEILDELGFQNVELTPRSGDKGRDVVASKRVNGIPVLFAFECKRHAPHRKVGVGIIRSLLGTVGQSSARADVGVLVTTSTFTRGAQNFFLTEARVKGRDFDGIVGWLNEIERLRQGA